MDHKTSTLLSIGISAVLVAAAIWLLFGHAAHLLGPHHGWHMPHGMMMGSGTGFLAVLFWTVAVIAIMFLVAALLSRRRAAGSEPALEILRKRYARGEIDRERFETMRRELPHKEGSDG